MTDPVAGPRFPSSMVLLLVLAIPTTMARGQAPEAVLKGEGLSKVGTSFVLPAEADLARSVTALRKLQKEYNQASAVLRSVEQDLRQAQKLVPQLVEQRLVLNQQLRLAQQGGASTPQYNQIVADFNEVNDRINLLQLRIADTKALAEVRDQAAQKRDSLLQSALAIRKTVDQADARYQELADSPAVAEAIEQLNRQAKTKLAIGPSRTYQANLKTFEIIAATLLTESIPLRMDGGVGHVDVALNGKVTRSMVFDTGASMVSLPADLATAAGVDVGPDAPRIQVSVADGRKFEARRGVLNSVRVGKFTVEQVECVVMPAEFANAPALLGGSFLRHFSARLDQAGQTLTLSQVAEDPAPPSTGRKK